MEKEHNRLSRYTQAPMKGFASDFTERYHYDPNVNYDEVLREFNRLSAEHDRNGLNRLMDTYGDLIGLILKANYQRQVRTKD